MNNPVITKYKGFKLNTTQNGESHTTVATLNGDFTFGTFSHLDELSSVEKMHNKIDTNL